MSGVYNSYEHWRDTDHDDLVLAMALACWWVRRKQSRPLPQTPENNPSTSLGEGEQGDH